MTIKCKTAIIKHRTGKTLAAKEEKQDKHFPLFAHDNIFRRLFSNSKEFCSYVTTDQTAADLGCGPGFYTIGLAECVGPQGKVYAVDSDEKAIQAVKKKASRHGIHNIEAHVSSASDLRFIQAESVDFVLANGLLCSMAPKYHESTIEEIKRIMKPSGSAYLSAAKGFYSYMSKAEWDKILEEFNVQQKGDPIIGERWAIASKKQQ